MAVEQSRRRGIHSLEIGVDLFQHVHHLGRPVTLTEISRLSKMAPAKAHRYCVSLIRTGLLQQDARGLYSVGPYGFSMSHADLEKNHARALGIAALHGLVNEINETAFLSEWSLVGPRIIEVVDPVKPISIRPSTRGQIPLHLSAVGRIFTAFMDEQRVVSLIDAELARFRQEHKMTAAQARSRKQAFLKQLHEVRRRRLARSIGERYPGLVSFAAPIFDRHSRVLLALTTFGLTATLPPAWDGPVPRALLKCALELTNRIGGRTP
jgi:DNA-binding IclR family transcriptional regulator